MVSANDAERSRVHSAAPKGGVAAESVGSSNQLEMADSDRHHMSPSKPS